MRPMRCLGLLTLTGLSALAEPVYADVYVQAPFVRIHVVSRRGPVGPSVLVAPAPASAPVVVQVAPAGPALPVPPAPPAPPVIVPGSPPPVPVDPLPAPTPLPPVPAPITPPLGVTPVIPAPLKVPTLAEFAATFNGPPGRYEVVLMHPATHCPVKVCFTLRCCPRRVKAHARSLDFDLPGRDLVIRFRHNGSVVVRD